MAVDNQNKVPGGNPGKLSSSDSISWKKTGNPYPTAKGNDTVSVFTVIISILLVFAVFRVLMSQNPLTFAGLLNSLQNAPNIDLTFLTDFSKVVLDFPDWLNFLEPVVAFLVNLISVLGFVFGGLLQALLFIIYILKWLLIG